QVPGPLLGAGLGHEGGPGVEGAGEVDAGARGTGPAHLLEEDELLDGCEAPPAAVDRPVEAGVAGVVEAALPGGVELTAAGPVVDRGPGGQLGECRRQPVAHLVTKGLFGLAQSKVHVRSSCTVPADR